MNYGIIAAGEGSRLAQEGVAKPKPLVELNGEPMVQRLINIFCRCKAESISIIVNEHMTEVREFLSTLPTSCAAQCGGEDHSKFDAQFLGIEQSDAEGQILPHHRRYHFP